METNEKVYIKIYLVGRNHSVKKNSAVIFSSLCNWKIMKL